MSNPVSATFTYTRDLNRGGQIPISTSCTFRMPERPPMDRTRVVKTTLRDQDDRGVIRDATPAERMGMVWQLTLDAWTFMDPAGAKSEFQRHVGRIKRRGS